MIYMANIERERERGREWKDLKHLPHSAGLLNVGCSPIVELLTASDNLINKTLNHLIS